MSLRAGGYPNVRTIYFMETEIGKRYGRLIVTNYLGRFPNGKFLKHKVSVICDCGISKNIWLNNLRTGHTTSCGCYRHEVELQPISHGLRWHPLYSVWCGLKRRCYNKNDPSYKRYGAKGIKMCNEWKNDVISFYEWAIANGWQKRLEIDRYPDKFGNYEPNNCRIATSKQNNNNRTNNRFIQYNGQSKTISEWSDIIGLSYSIIQNRVLRYKWDIHEAFTTPVRKKIKK